MNAFFSVKYNEDENANANVCFCLFFSYAFVIPSFFSVFSAFSFCDIFMLSFHGFSNTVFVFIAFLSNKIIKTLLHRSNCLMKYNRKITK